MGQQKAPDESDDLIGYLRHLFGEQEAGEMVTEAKVIAAALTAMKLEDAKAFRLFVALGRTDPLLGASIQQLAGQMETVQQLQSQAKRAYWGKRELHRQVRRKIKDADIALLLDAPTSEERENMRSLATALETFINEHLPEKDQP